MIRKSVSATCLALCLSLVMSGSGLAQSSDPVRARDLGIPFPGSPGPNNAITDVAGVTVGHATIVDGDTVRTGVTVVFPLGAQDPRGVRAATAQINGTGEMTGTHLIDETGLLFGPILTTNTWSVGTVRDGYLRWVRETYPEDLWFLFSLPVVAETSDFPLNDMFGMHVQPEHVAEAIANAASGPVTEGNVGGGTGTLAYGFKGGIGTASRQVTIDGEIYTVGVLLQANHGLRENLRIAGVPVNDIVGPLQSGPALDADRNSLIIIVATDAPLRPDQLQRIANRAELGLGRTGSIVSGFSGDLVIAFSTSGPLELEPFGSIEFISFLNVSTLNALFGATVEAVEEALINQLVASETMTANGFTAEALPHAAVLDYFRPDQ